MKWISLIALILSSLILAGCFQRLVNFDPPPYVRIEHDALPAKVERAFRRACPIAPIQQIETLTWPPTGEQHYRLTFENDGETIQIRYNQRGKKLGEPQIANGND